MRLTIEVVPVSRHNVGILVMDRDTREPVEVMTIVCKRDIVPARAAVLDRWSSEPAVLSIVSPAIPAWVQHAL